MPWRRRGNLLELDPFLLPQRQIESLGNTAGLGHRVQHHATDDLFFFRAAAGVFFQFQCPVSRLAGGLHGDVGAVGALFRPIGGQSGCTRHAGRLLFRRPVAHRTVEGDDRHGPRGPSRAELFRPAAEPCRERSLGVGHGRFQQNLGAARYFQQFGHGPAPAAGEHEDDLPSGSVDLSDEFFSKETHGSCAVSR